MRGQRLPFVVMLGSLLLVVILAVGLGAESVKKYTRTDWPHWSSPAGDCQNTRTKVLIREHRDHKVDGTETAHVLLWRDGRECEVAFGHWTDPYTGEVVHDPGKLDVDHLVPLENAHRAGGATWTREQKRAYANDLAYRWHLVPVLLGENRKKGSQGPEGYRPPARAFWCQYGQAWATVKARWGLSISNDERKAINRLTDAC